MLKKWSNPETITVGNLLQWIKAQFSLVLSEEGICNSSYEHFHCSKTPFHL